MVVERVIEQVEMSKEKMAIITKTCSRTYKELYDNVIAFAKKINEIGLEKNEPVGIAFPNSVEFIELLLASELARHPAILLGVMLKPDELEYHAINAGLRIIFSSKQVESVLLNMKCTRKGVINETIDCWAFDNHVFTGSDFIEGDFICQLTSGTNGVAKGAIRTSNAVLHEIKETVDTINLSRNDIVITIPPIHHSYGLIAGTLAPLCVGAQVVLIDGFRPADVKKLIKSMKATILFAVPFMYHIMNQSGGINQEDFESLRICFSAGAPIHPDIVDLFYKKTGKLISQDYGSTETGVMCLNINLSTNRESVGLPVGNRQISAFNSDGNILPAGEVGEIRTKSLANARCYLYPEGINDDAYKNGWFNICDYGKIDENGYVYILGRKSNMINVAGLKVDPGEIEKVIKNIPRIKEVVVIGIDSKSCGQVIKAVIVSEDEKKDENYIIKFCKEHLADYKLPRIIEFVNTIPRSQTGKILRKYLM